MNERGLLGVSRLLTICAGLWVTSYSRAMADASAAEIPSMWTQGLGSAYLFGFGGGIILFFALMLMKAREDKPQKGGK